VQINTTASRPGAQYTFLSSTNARLRFGFGTVILKYSIFPYIPLRFINITRHGSYNNCSTSFLEPTTVSITTLHCEVIERLPQEFRYSTHPSVVNESNQPVNSVEYIYIYICNHVYLPTCNALVRVNKRTTPWFQ
jgi:V8-like Glu-specific endopeptidase